MLPTFKKELTEYPMLDAPITVRLAFSKTGALQYISHLDLQQTAQRLLTRSVLPLWYTQGFNPHAKLVFGLPLSVGCESVCELLDIRIERDMPTCEILERIREKSYGELEFTACYIPETKLADIATARYEINIESDKNNDAGAREALEILSSTPLTVMKRSKSGTKETDISPMIRSLEVSPCERGLKLSVILAAGAGGSLNPEYLIDILKEKMGILQGDEEYTVMRTEMLFADLTHFE